MKNFGEDKTPITLVLELSRIKMTPKEKIKYFNQIFLTLMNKMPEYFIPTDIVIIWFYTISLPSSIFIFVKRDGKNTLVETFEETLNVEKEMMSIEGKAPTEEKWTLKNHRW